MFCTDNKCYLPLHNFTTDCIDSHGGSAMLVKILNRLGVCLSADTLARSIQHYITERQKRSPEKNCKPCRLKTYCRSMMGQKTRSAENIKTHLSLPKDGWWDLDRNRWAHIITLILVWIAPCIHVAIYNSKSCFFFYVSTEIWQKQQGFGIRAREMERYYSKYYVRWGRCWRYM